MSHIFLRNKENFEVDAGASNEKFFAVYQKNMPGPYGLWQTSLPAALKRLSVEPPRPARFSLQDSDVCRQRNSLELANSA